MDEKRKCCGTCKWHKRESVDDGWICVNWDSEYCSDLTDYDHCCDEWDGLKQMRKAIAIDFDGCLCTDAYPEIGEPNWPVICRAKEEQRAGTGLILWTCREDQLLLDAIAACDGWGLTFDAVNESLPDWIKEYGTRPRKVGASEYWDDKAARIPVAHQFFVGGPCDDSIELIESMPNEDAALESCPFCGSSHVFYERYAHKAGERWRCWCAECLAGIDPGYAQDWWTVARMWNRRAVLSRKGTENIKEAES